MTARLTVTVSHNIQSPFAGLEKVDQIYHLACPASPIQYQSDPVSTLKTCFVGTENLLELAKARRIRILHTSTSGKYEKNPPLRTRLVSRGMVDIEVYGDPQVHPQSESYWGNVNPFGPRACYDEGKRVAEALCYAYREQSRLDIRIARIFNAYGPRMRANDGRVISRFISSALAGQALRITGDGAATRSFQYVSDCIEGLYMLMNSDYGDGPVNIGNDAEITIQDVAEMTAELVSQMSGQRRVPITYHPLPVDDVRVRRPDITLAKLKLGWAPVVHLQDGLRKTIEWHIQNSESAGPY